MIGRQFVIKRVRKRYWWPHYIYRFARSCHWRACHPWLPFCTIAETYEYEVTMTPLEMIAEWRKGCTISMFGDGGKGPEECPECTRELIDALERKLRYEAQVIDGGVAMKLRYIWIGGILVGIPVGSALGWLSAFVWLPLGAWACYRIWKENQ